jgi:hypothetical protein
MKRFALNWFKGYQMFDFHFWPHRVTAYMSGWRRGTKHFSMIGFTLFYLRVEFFVFWKYEGNYWR